MSPQGRGAGGKSSVGAGLPNRADVYGRRNTVLYECEICYLMHLELKIGLVIDGSGIYIYMYVNVMPAMDMIICEP